MGIFKGRIAVLLLNDQARIYCALDHANKQNAGERSSTSHWTFDTPLDLSINAYKKNGPTDKDGN
jgi:hypothetical protein